MKPMIRSSMKKFSHSYMNTKNTLQYIHRCSFSEMRFSNDHEWILKTDGGEYNVGITDYAQDSLGEIVYIEFPSIGDSFDKGEVFGQLESVKAASELYMPITGTVTAVNETLGDEPGVINSSPQKDGWMIRIKVDDESEIDSLMDSTKYIEYTESL